MDVSQRGLEFLGDWEGLRNQLYDDGGPGKGNATIGIGHLVHLGPIDGRPEEAPFANGLTDNECYTLLAQDIPRYEAVVDSHATVPLNQNQYDALVDFCYNTGGGYPKVWHAVNSSGDVAAVLLRTAITPAWATAALVRRRKAEGDLYNLPVAPASPVEGETVLLACGDSPSGYRLYQLAVPPVWIVNPIQAQVLKDLSGEPKGATWGQLQALGAT